MSGADDPQLLDAAARGDRAAFGVFVGRHQAHLFRYLTALAGSHADAEDALQETFVAAWKGADGYRGGPSARAWLFAIGRNALHRANRRRVGEPASFESVERLGVRAGWGQEEDMLEGLARKELLARALDRLPPEDREVLVLRELEGFSGEETAQLLELSVAAMKSRLHRARLRFVAAVREVDRG